MGKKRARQGSAQPIQSLGLDLLSHLRITVEMLLIQYDFSMLCKQSI